MRRRRGLTPSGSVILPLQQIPPRNGRCVSKTDTLLPSHSWVYGYTNAKTAKGNPVVHCPAGERKHELAKEYLAKTNITQGVFLILAGRAQAPMWDVSANHLGVNIFQKS